MQRKSAQVTQFIEGLHNFIISSKQYRGKTDGISEVRIQAEIRPLIIRYLEDYFTALGYKDPIKKANASFYWEGEEGTYEKKRTAIFGSRNYPDFIIKKPYLIAIEYKKSKSGSLVKQLIGQSIMHTLCDEYGFVYCLFHDQNKDKRIKRSISSGKEQFIIEKMWNDFNVFVRFT